MWRRRVRGERDVLGGAVDLLAAGAQQAVRARRSPATQHGQRVLRAAAVRQGRAPVPHGARPGAHDAPAHTVLDIHFP